MPTLLEKTEMPATVRVEEAFRTPLTNRLEEIVEEAEEIKPARLESPVTPKVFATVTEEEACNAPAICRVPAMVEEAEEINPPYNVERLATSKVEEAFKGPFTLNKLLTVEDPLEINPDKIELPATVKVLEADNGPETFNELEIVEEAEEI